MAHINNLKAYKTFEKTFSCPRGRPGIPAGTDTAFESLEINSLTYKITIFEYQNIKY